MAKILIQFALCTSACEAFPTELIQLMTFMIHMWEGGPHAQQIPSDGYTDERGKEKNSCDNFMDDAKQTANSPAHSYKMQKQSKSQN